jgi:hypothetical protein
MNLNVSHKTQLFVAAASASLGTLAVVSAYNSYSKTARRNGLNDHVLRSIATHESNIPVNANPSTVHALDVTSNTANAELEYDDTLVREQVRLALLYLKLPLNSPAARTQLRVLW